MGIETYTWGLNASSVPSPSSFDLSPILSLTLPSAADWAKLAAAGFVGYLSLCAALRYQRLNRVKRKYKYTTRESLSRMTVVEAQAIAKQAMYYEFPTLYEMSLQFALFKTYAVRNVARTLVNVSDLAKGEHAAKRYEDTSIIYSCFAQFKPDDEEFLNAVARMNFLHAPYFKSGKILNKDFLYVLWASMYEPGRFMGMFEWRPLSDMEQAALGTIWKHIGDLMGIDYKAELGNDSWKDGIEFIEEVTVWAHEYENQYMNPYPEVRKLGVVLVDLFTSSYPSYARNAVRQITMVLMGDRMRNAFGFPDPSLGWTVCAYSALYMRQLTMRYLSLPRFFPVKNISAPDPKTGRMHRHVYLKEPWYNASTFKARWGLEAWATWSWGGILPGDSKEYRPEGFLFQDLGPNKQMGKGIDEISKADRLLMKRDVNTSPFAPAPQA